MSSWVPADRSMKVSDCDRRHNVQSRYLNNNVPKQELEKRINDINDVPSATAVETPEKFIHCVMHRLWKHLIASPSTELPDKVDALTGLIDFWEKRDAQQAAFDTKPVVQCKNEIQLQIKEETHSETSSNSSSEYSIDTKANGISEMTISSSKRFKSSHDSVENRMKFEKTNQPGADVKKSSTMEPIVAKRLLKETKELIEIAKEHSLLAESRLRSSTIVSGFFMRQERLMPFSAKSESNQIKDMLRWLAVPNGTLEQVISFKYKLRKEDFKCDPQNLRDSFLDDTVNIELLKPHLECSTLRVLKRVIDEKKDSDVWSCGSCSERIIARAIFCDECLTWFHYKCVSISSIPDRNASWFCPACSSND